MDTDPSQEWLALNAHLALLHKSSRLTMAQPPSPASAPSSSDTLQTHLYSAFLNHSLPDVALNVQGRSWHAVYHAHKVVLVQAGFFRELFTGGFAESSHGGGDVDVVLYDTNITRAAFELCLARLYGGGPALYLSPALIPTTAQPLTPSFPYPPPVAFPPTPAGHQLATPRFLMSLLATAAYLALPTLVAQALGMILKTIGPRTAVPYLKFAIGDGIGEGEEGDDDESPAVGLEGVAEMQLESSAASIAESFETLTLSRSQRSEEHGEVIEEEDVRKEDPEQLGHEDSKESEESDGGLYLRYGGLSDKIGQAAACWLARWGPDMLAYELQVAPPLAAPPTPKTPVLSSPISPLRGRPSTSPSSSGAGSGSGLREKGKMPFMTSIGSPLAGLPPPDVPRVWRRGGLGAAWVRALVASDTLCVRGEKERYELAKTIVELRRAEGVDTAEEQEFTRMFAEGIYYANIPVDDLVALSAERSPTTGRSFVPRSLVQAAHWSASLLRHTIVRPSSSSPPQSPAPGGRANTGNSELGVAVSAAELKATVEAGEIDAEMAVWPVRTEVTERVGDTSGLEGASLDELFELPSSASGLQSTHLTRPGGSKGPSPTAADFFGLASDRTKAGDVDGTNGRWTSHPPLRFAAEFWDVDALREKQRLHSHTVWYAGSLYNVYVQLVRRPPRGAQLGVYLHRQSSVDPLPGASAPAGLALASPPPSQSWERTDREIRAERERAGVMSTGRARAGSAATSPAVGPGGGSGVGLPYSFSMTPRAGTPTPVPGSPGSAPTSSSPLHSSASSLSASLPATSPPVNPPAPYRDSRAQVAAYFTVACPSATGSALTRFSSGPDVFAVSQSWGWKSSSLRPDEFAGANGEGVTPSGPECSVRVAVVIGVV